MYLYTSYIVQANLDTFFILIKSPLIVFLGMGDRWNFDCLKCDFFYNKFCKPFRHTCNHAYCRYFSFFLNKLLFYKCVVLDLHIKLILDVKIILFFEKMSLMAYHLSCCFVWTTSVLFKPWHDHYIPIFFWLHTHSVQLFFLSFTSQC